VTQRESGYPRGETIAARLLAQRLSKGAHACFEYLPQGRVRGVSAAVGQSLTLSDVKAKNATQRGANGLKELMPNAKVVNRLATGTTRNWTDKSEWTFVA
jgi:hypothetical protein